MAAGAVLAVALVPALALGHVERPAYWPVPAAEKVDGVSVGGKVPKTRSLGSALKAKPPGETHVVCRTNSMGLLRRSVANARKDGYDLRPTDHRQLSRKKGRRLMRINRRLADRCEFDQIQDAVDAAGNNDRVVIMPGLYTEPDSRAAPTNDPACADMKVQDDKGTAPFGQGEANAVTYEYQVNCPNDQNLIAVLGRELGPGEDPSPPLDDRNGIPNLGSCIRCNLQIEGSGVSADDVIIDAGEVSSGDGAPIGAVKDVGIRADRADGFVLRNVNVRHATEHGVYVLESDGYRLERFKVPYSGEYGVLTFTSDHGLIQDCDAFGNPDAGIYPGSAPDTRRQRPAGTDARYNTELRRCDMHHNALGYSGTNSNAVHIHHNNFFDNVQGLSTDVFTGAGHPGYPQDSDLIERNDFYSNNFDAYAEGSDVEPTVPVPVGTGMWIAGGNADVVRDNRFWDNWRRGVMLFGVPDVFVCGPQTNNTQAGCDPNSVTTSFDNRFHDNLMGVAPNGKRKPNGLDFWWDDLAGNTGNCWYGNSADRGGSVTMSPDPLPDCNDGQNPEASVGSGSAGNQAELIECLVAIEGGADSACTWFEKPPKPGS